MKKRQKTTKKITTEDLAIMVAKGFESTATKNDISEVNKRLEDIEYRLGKIESNHERRIDNLEDKMNIVKTYFERNPQLKVKF